MKIDLGVVRKILTQIEAETKCEDFNNKGLGFVRVKEISDIKFELLVYHIRYLIDGGFISTVWDSDEYIGTFNLERKTFNVKKQHTITVVNHAGGERKIDFISLTYKGHEFLNSIKNDKTFAQLLKNIKKRGGGIILSIIFDEAKSLYSKNKYKVWSAFWNWIKSAVPSFIATAIALFHK